MSTTMIDWLQLDAAAEAARIQRALPQMVSRTLRRRGVVLGVSGGVDSAVCLALAAGALGPERVFALLMPERDFDPAGTERGRALCESFGVDYVLEDIAPALEVLGCYRRRDDAIRRLFPDYGPEDRCKIVIAEGVLERERLPFFDLVVASPEGLRRRARMPPDVYLEVVAATNMKQRTRRLVEYTHAERLNAAVVGTPNRLEYALGFFVRGGDGLADLKPIAHLYKAQVMALAQHLGVPDAIREQPPSTDTWSLPQTQDEFYFALPWALLDQLLYAFSNQISAEDAAPVVGLEPEQVRRVYRDIEGKRRVAERGLRSALLVEPIPF